MSAFESLDLSRRIEIEQAIARGNRPSRVMADFDITYAEYRGVADAMVDGYEPVKDSPSWRAIEAKRARKRRNKRDSRERDRRVAHLRARHAEFNRCKRRGLPISEALHEDERDYRAQKQRAQRQRERRAPTEAVAAEDSGIFAGLLLADGRPVDWRAPGRQAGAA